MSKFKSNQLIVICLILCSLVSNPSKAQNNTNLLEIKPDTTYENIWVKKLYSNPKSSSFVIWIKDSVQLHKHERHSETVYILEGTGEMVLGEHSLKVKPGDVIEIQEGTAHSVIVISGPLKVLSVQAPEFFGKDRIFLE